jgi:uncharacterized protein (TIGR03435 family)
MRSLFVATLLVTISAAAQTPSSFEVASIKRSDATAGSQLQYLPGGRFRATAWTKLLIQTAYGVEDYQVTGGPAWINTDRYDIDANGGAGAGKKEMLAMLKALLSDRFKLRLREERRDLPVYDLVVEKNGHKLRALKDGEPPPCRRGDSFICGLTSVAELANWLKYIVGRPVLDKTGISGRFDLLLDFDVYSIRGQAPPQDYDKPSVFEALKEQFGLRLEPQKAATPVLIVESIQRPTQN